MASKIKISDSPVPPKATFLRKSAFLTTGDETFRFNFNISPENLDNDNTKDSVKINSNTETTDKQLSTNVASVEKIDDDKKEGTVKSEQKNFKFTFSQSSFKFNFPIEDS